MRTTKKEKTNANANKIYDRVLHRVLFTSNAIKHIIQDLTILTWINHIHMNGFILRSGIFVLYGRISLLLFSCPMLNFIWVIIYQSNTLYAVWRTVKRGFPGVFTFFDHWINPYYFRLRMPKLHLFCTEREIRHTDVWRFQCELLDFFSMFAICDLVKVHFTAKRKKYQFTEWFGEKKIINKFAFCFYRIFRSAVDMYYLYIRLPHIHVYSLFSDKFTI